MGNLTSTFSFLLATLLLSGNILVSGQVLAATTDLSEQDHLNVTLESHVSENGYYMALNRYPVAIPPIKTQHQQAVDEPYQEGANEAYLDGLQQRLRDQLNFIIDSQLLD